MNRTASYGRFSPAVLITNWPEAPLRPPWGVGHRALGASQGLPGQGRWTTVCGNSTDATPANTDLLIENKELAAKLEGADQRIRDALDQVADLRLRLDQSEGERRRNSGPAYSAVDRSANGRPKRRQADQQPGAGNRVRHVRRLNAVGERKAEHIDQNVAFPSFHPLVAIEAANAPFSLVLTD